MANFNLADYETVEERLRRFTTLFEDGRVITDNVTTLQDRERGTWVVKATIYLNADDQLKNLPKATGYAFEVDGTGGANRTAALENAETSAIGRALANMALSGNKRASREEMMKANRAPVEPVKWDKPLINWDEELVKADTKHACKGLYALAKAENAPSAVLEAITAKGKAFID